VADLDLRTAQYGLLSDLMSSEELGLSFECIYFKFYPTQQSHPFLIYIKALLIFIFPLFITALTMIFISLLNIVLVLLKRRAFEFFSSSKLAFLIIVFVMQPQIIQNIFSLFNCIPLPSTQELHLAFE
jgi:hypothetical protein